MSTMHHIDGCQPAGLFEINATTYLVTVVPKYRYFIHAFDT